MLDREDSIVNNSPLTLLNPFKPLSHTLVLPDSSQLGAVLVSPHHPHPSTQHAAPPSPLVRRLDSSCIHYDRLVFLISIYSWLTYNDLASGERNMASETL
jgi:hypothetical protein